jgi:hypothetical protein
MLREKPMGKWKKKTDRSERKRKTARETVKPQPTRIRLEVFMRLSGRKPDQMAGFAWYARKQKLGPLSVPEWHEALAAFDARPVT